MSYDYAVELKRRGGVDLDTRAVALEYHRRAVEGGDREEWRTGWVQHRLGHRDIEVPLAGLWERLSIPRLAPELLPPYALWLQLPFRLSKPYLSRDERTFHVIDNPVRRERLFGVPMVAPSTWKGSLRAALWNLGKEQDDPVVRRLLGNEREASEDFCAGHLRFYPTFFTRHGVEMINPHDRERRVGINPILFESVPSGTPGLFTLLYLPFDRIGLDDAVTRRQVAADLEWIAIGVRAMLCVYGFGAKTASGHGLAGEHLLSVSSCRRFKLPRGRAILNAVPGEPEAVRAFEREQGGTLDELTEDEWCKMLDDEALARYREAVAARDRHRQALERGRVERELDSLGKMEATLRSWAGELRKEVP